MSKRRRKEQGPPQSASSSSPASVKTGDSKLLSSSRNTPAKKRLLFCFTALVVVPIVVLALLELILRLCGYGYSTAFFVKMQGTNAYTTNHKFCWRFSPPEIATQPYPVIFPAQKEPGAKRVFILGESAAQGTPVPAFGFSRILEVMLAEQFPANRLEILNVALRGINSYAILPIARECARHEPDLFIIYMGNNETVGLHAPTPGGPSLEPPLWMLRAGQGIKDSKLGQLISNLIRAVRKKTRPEQDMAFFRKHSLSAESPRRQKVYDNFQANLQDILRVTRASGAKVLLCTVAGNIVDFPPLVSLHGEALTPAGLSRWEALYKKGIEAEEGRHYSEAISNYFAAATVDKHYAELHFRLARCCQAVDDMKYARKHFVLARDRDALQLRTDSRLNSIIINAATSGQPGTTTLIDVDEIFTARTLKAKPSDAPLFHEHVHLTFDGDYLLAKTVLAPAIKALGLGTSSAPIPSRQKCAEALALSEWDELNLASLAAKLTSKPPFLDQLEHAQRQQEREGALQLRQSLFQQNNGFARARQLYQQALARRPNDWQIHMNCAMLLATLRDTEGLVRHYAASVNLMPVFLPVRILYAQALVAAGQREAAIQQLEEILRYDPDYKPAKEGLQHLR